MNNTAFLEFTTLPSTPETARSLHEDCVQFLERYPFRIVHVVGLISNLVCIVVFINIVFEHHQVSQMFKYLLAKSVADFAIFCFQVFEIAYNCDDCTIKDSYIMQLWNIVINNYATRVCEICSVYFELAATFDCYITISKKFNKCLSNACYVTICLCTVLFSMLLNIYNLFSMKIFGFNNKFSTVIIYIFYVNDLYKSLVIITIVLRDIFPLVGLLVLNCLILFFLKDTTHRRRVLEGVSRRTPTAMITSAKRAERAKVIMILLTGLNFQLGHLPFLITKLDYWNSEVDFTNIDDMTKMCFHRWAEFFYYFSFATSILFYVGFNQKFQRITFKHVPCFNRTVDPNIRASATTATTNNLKPMSTSTRTIDINI